MPLQQHPAVVAVQQRRLEMVLAYADLAFGLGEHQRAVTGLQTLAHEERLHEGLHARPGPAGREPNRP